MILKITLYFMLRFVDIALLCYYMKTVLPREFVLRHEEGRCYQHVLAYLPYYILPGILFFTYNHAALNSLASLVGIFCISYYYSQRLSLSIRHTFVIYALTALAEIYIGFPMILFQQILISEFASTSFFLAIFLSKCCMLLFFTIYFLIYKKNTFKPIPLPLWLNALLIFLFLLLVAILILILFTTNAFNIYTRFQLILVFLLMLSLPITLILFLSLEYFYTQATYSTSILYQNQGLKERLILLQEKEDAQRSFNHDQIAHLQQMRVFLAQKDYDSLQTYLDNYTQSMASYKQTRSFGHPILDALLNHFDQKCLKNHYHLSLDVQLAEPILVSDFDLTVILTNLLDNAFNALAQSKSATNEKIILVSLKTQENVLFITIINSISLEQVHYKPNIGLRNVHQAVAKYSGQFTTNIREGKFIANALLYQSNRED